MGCAGVKPTDAANRAGVIRNTSFFKHDTVAETLSAASVIEAAILTSPQPLTLEQLSRLFDGRVKKTTLLQEIGHLTELWSTRGLRLVETAQGWRFQTTTQAHEHIARLSGQKPPKYSRAVMETLAIIAYRQPATRGDIEEIRGVTVNPNILRQLQERGWIEEIGRRETPGRPSLFGTTKQFLVDLGLKSLADLPPLPGQMPQAEEFELNLPDPVSDETHVQQEASMATNQSSVTGDAPGAKATDDNENTQTDRSAIDDEHTNSHT